MKIQKAGRRKSDQFLEVVARFDDVVFVTHDNPDPDGLACGWALGELVRQKLGKNFRLVARGAVMRAENQHLLALLNPPLEMVEDLSVAPTSLVVLIDCRPEALNHLPLQNVSLAVIDHHNGTKSMKGPVIFRDIRPHVAATATISACYLREHEIPLSPRLATALAYAIRTEGGGGSVTFSALDRRMLSWVSGTARADLLAQIEEAPLPRTYFSDLTHALQNTTLVAGHAYCMLPSVAVPETIGEVADLLIRCEGIEAVLCCGLYEEKVILSTRTRRGSSKDATVLISSVVDGMGHSGGHKHRAGGLIPLKQLNANDAWLTSELKKRWLAACGVDGYQETPLVEPINKDIRGQFAPGIHFRMGADSRNGCQIWNLIPWANGSSRP